LLSDVERTGSAQLLAARAAELTEQLVRHVARLIGETGITALFKRSVVLSSTAFPWLTRAPRAPEITPIAALGAALAEQRIELAHEAFLVVVSTFIALLGRLIGDVLVRGMLQEVWPGSFHSDKEQE
jgi:hypothetical protein